MLRPAGSGDVPKQESGQRSLTTEGSWHPGNELQFEFVAVDNRKFLLK
jgi:hypothetical protein